MKKIKSFLKRGLCILLVSVTLSMTVASDFYGARYCQAVGTATALEAFIEAVMIACGYSCRSRQDLTNTTNGFSYMYNLYKEKGLFEGTKYIALHTTPLALNDLFKVGEKIVFDTPAKQALRDFAVDYVKKRVASSRGQVSKTTTPDITESFTTPQIQHGQITTSQLTSVWNNMPIDMYYTRDVVESININPSVVKNKLLVVGKKVDLSTGAMMFWVGYCFNQSFENVYVQQDNGVISLCNARTGEIYRSYSVSYFELEKSRAGDTHLTVDNSVDGDVTQINGENVVTGNVKKNSYPIHYYMQDLLEDGYSLCVYSAFPVYDSFQDYVATNTAITSFPTATYVGDGTKTKDISESADIGDGSLTSSIEAAVNSALENNPSISQEDLDAITNDIINQLDGVQDSIEDGTQVQTVGNTWLSKIYQVVNAKFDVNLSSIAQSVSSLGSKVLDLCESVEAIDISEISNSQEKSNTFLSSLVDGTSALKEDVEDISESLTVLDGGGGQEPEEDPNEGPKVWIPIIPSVLAIFKPILKFFAEPLSIVTKYLDNLKNNIEDIRVGWQEWIKGTYDNCTGIFTQQMPQIIGHLTTLAQAVVAFPTALPQAYAKALAEILPDIEFAPIPLELPESWPEPDPLEFPEPINYMNILEQILAAILGIFALDMFAIQDAALGLENGLDEIYPDLPELRGIFDGFHFSNSVSYPVIKIKTPDIIKTAGYSSEYIILLDFADYAVYCVWARELVRCFIWIAFVYSIFGHFKVRFSID